MQGEWEKVERGRYALKMGEYQLQVIRNPDPEDQRRYVAVVDKKPVGQPQWNLREAKTLAMRACNFGEEHSGRSLHKDIWRPDDVIEEPAVQPIQEPGETTAVAAPSIENVALPPGVCTFRFQIRGEVRTNDPVRALSSVQAAIRLLEELGVVQNEIFPPGVLSL